MSSVAGLDVKTARGDTSAARGEEPVRSGGFMTGWSKGRLLEGGWLLLWVLASSVWCVSASARLGATFDEPTYMTLGLESWRTGSSKGLLDLGTMPLPPHV